MINGRRASLNGSLHSVALVLLLAVSLSLQAEEELVYDFQLSLLNEDNVGKGFLAQDVHADQIVQSLLGVTHEIEINNKSALFLNVNFQNQSYADYAKLSNNQLTARIEYIFQTNIAFLSPVYTLSASLTEADYGSVLRDSSSVKFSARLLKRFTTRIKTAAEYAYIIREADSNVFDNTVQTTLLLLDYSVTDKISLFGSYRYQSGDSVSTMTTTDPALLIQLLGYDIINKADQAGALLPDDAFGGAAADQYAYRIDAKTQITEFGASVVFNERHGMDVSVMMITSEIENGLEYDNYIVQLGYLARF